MILLKMGDSWLERTWDLSVMRSLVAAGPYLCFLVWYFRRCGFLDRKKLDDMIYYQCHQKFSCFRPISLFSCLTFLKTEFLTRRSWTIWYILYVMKCLVAAGPYPCFLVWSFEYKGFLTGKRMDDMIYSQCHEKFVAAPYLVFLFDSFKAGDS